ncbi:MAG TPA: sulfite exporter TauE/SafE family protein [Candidatus Limnocylindrales bacterium]|nr:sulfite exporter TauE/SafE family protein [Candidatus Limnocylindrales bacterium]
MVQLLAIAVAGFLAQLIDGSLGMGYGVSSTSLLLALGLAPALASASVHLAEIGTSGVSGAAHWRYGNVDWKILLLLGIPGGVGAFFGAVVLSNLTLEQARPWVSVVLLILGGVILFRFLHARRTSRAPAALHDQAPVDDSGAGFRSSRRRSWLLTPLGLLGGFLDASGGGGWGPTTTSTLMAGGRLKPRLIIGTVSGSEFIVAISASIGFLLALGAAGIRWDIVAMMLIGGSIAAPISAWLVKQFDDRALGIAVGALIIVLNVDRLMVLVGIDAGIVTTARLMAVVAALLIISALVFRGRARRAAEGERAASAAGAEARPV